MPFHVRRYETMQFNEAYGVMRLNDVWRCVVVLCDKMRFANLIKDT
jgi:hypothetical protein